MAREVQTVRGKVAGSDLGRVYIHEHFGWGFPGWELGYPFDTDRFIDTAVAALTAIKPFVSTVVDAAPADMGRDPAMLREISERSGMNLVCCTGLFRESMGSTFYKYRASFGDVAREIYEMFTREFENGIGDTGIRPGLIKVSTDKEITDRENMFLEVAARVAIEQDVSIITHVEDGRQGAEQARRLIACGVRPQRIMIGHLNNVMDMNEMSRIFKQGVFGGFDRWGLTSPFVESAGEKEQIAIAAGMIHSGYGKQIIFSHDASLQIRGVDMTGMEDRLKARNPWKHIPDVVLPALAGCGVTQEQIDDIMIHNPHAFLCN